MNKIISVKLPKAIDYGAVEFKNWIHKHTMRGVLVAFAFTLALFLFVVISAMMQYQVFFAPITDIRSVDISMVSATEQETAEEDALNEPPPDKIQINTGPAARAGNPVAVPDSEVTPDMQEFAAIDVVDRASTEGGTGEDMGGFSGNIDMNEVEVEEKIETMPEPDEFIPVEKEPQVSSLQDLMKLVVYPEVAKRAGIEGLVTVQVLISKTGKPIKAQILASENSNLNQAAIDAAMKYDGYTPAIQNDQPVNCWMILPINFQLR